MVETLESVTSSIHLNSADRITRIPVVESTIQTAAIVYVKVKDFNNATHWTISTVESAVQKAVDISKPYATPVVYHFEGPIKRIDGMLCTGLDYVEANIPVVKMSPGELYTGAKETVSNTVGASVETVKNIVEPKMETMMKLAEPVVTTAKDYIQPNVECAMKYVEPAVETAKFVVQPVVDTAKSYIEPAFETVCSLILSTDQRTDEKIPKGDDEIKNEEEHREGSDAQ